MAIGKRVLKPIDSLVNVVRTSIFTVLTQNFQKKKVLFCSVSFFEKSRKTGFWYTISSNHFWTKINRFYLLNQYNYDVTH